MRFLNGDYLLDTRVGARGTPRSIGAESDSGKEQTPKNIGPGAPIGSSTEAPGLKALSRPDHNVLGPAPAQAFNPAARTRRPYLKMHAEPISFLAFLGMPSSPRTPTRKRSPHTSTPQPNCLPSCGTCPGSRRPPPKRHRSARRCKPPRCPPSCPRVREAERRR